MLRTHSEFTTSALMLTQPSTAEPSTVAPSPIGPRSGSGAPPRASTSVKPVTSDASAARPPVTVNATDRGSGTYPRESLRLYGVAVSVYDPSNNSRS